MRDFKSFAARIRARFQEMSKHELYVLDIPGQEVWDLYLASFPAGTNPIYRVRTEHDGSYDRNFVRRLGNVVAVVDGKYMTIWDGEHDAPYNTVCAVLAARLREHKIDGLFRTKESTFGYESTVERLDTGATHRWFHFNATIAAKHKVASPAEAIGEANNRFGVFLRGLTEFTLEALDTVVDLAETNAVYRGAEFLPQVREFRKLFLQARSVQGGPYAPHTFAWTAFSTTSPGITGLRNTAIGTLITDLSEGVEMEQAVRSFESKVAPTNYRRPTALVTPKMVAAAAKTLEDLGLNDALERRHATMADLTVNNVLWVNNDVQHRMKDGIEGLLAKDMAKAAPAKAKAPIDIDIETFMSDVLPKTTSMEVLLSNRLTGNLASVTTAVNTNAPLLFKWNSPFAWSYRGNVTDSIKARVKRAGGNVDAPLRVSLAWSNFDDLDLHAQQPDKLEVWYANKRGVLDVDANGGRGTTREPVENLSWQNPKNGLYTIWVRQFCRRETVDVGFTIEIATASGTQQFSFSSAVKDGEVIRAFEFVYENGQVTQLNVMNKRLVEGSTSSTVWGLPTETYVKVNALMYSPNYWDNQEIGNKHWLFMLEGCNNDEPTRGIYNEFLRPELDVHRKVFELVGERTKVKPAQEQLSGLGFSSTQRNTVTVLAKGPKLHAHYTINF